MAAPAKLGRYELRETLGRGAMGVVYEGYDPVLGRRVAIKTILQNAAVGEDVVRDFAMRFTREAKAAARLSHPNIVQVYDFGVENDLSYLVMEFIQGTELAKFFEGGELFDLQDVTRLMTELLDALELAHNAGIVHRDIKPANVMVDNEGHAKLADFGVARVSDGQDATQVGSMVGTPAYMSPEQVQGQTVDRRTDIFSAGVILYQFLTGQKPFQGGGAYTLARMIIHDDPVMPSSLVASVSPEYDQVIRRALAKDREDRFQTAREFSQALNALVKEKPPQAEDAEATRKISVADMPKADATQTRAQPEPLATDVELEFWRSIKDSDDIDDFELYIAKFPTGVYLELAQRKVAKLKRAAGTAASAAAAAEESETLKRKLEAEAAAGRAAEEQAKIEAQAARAAQLKREAEAEAAAQRAVQAAAKAAAAPVTRPPPAPVPEATVQAEPPRKSSMAMPAMIGAVVVAAAGAAYFVMQPKAPVQMSAPVAPAPAPAQVVAPAPAKPVPQPVVAQPVAPTPPAPLAEEMKPVEKPAREVAKAAPAPAPAPAAKAGGDAVTKAAASKAAADAAAAKAAADSASAKTAAEEAAAKSAAAAAAAEQRAAAAEQRAAAAEKAAADRAAAEKAAADKVAADKVAAEKAAAAKGDAALAARRAARAKELEWTPQVSGIQNSRSRSQAQIDEILREEGLLPGGTPKPAPAAPPAAAAKGDAGKDDAALAARRAARAKELEWDTAGGFRGAKPRSQAQIDEILRQEGLLPGGTPKPAPAAAPAAAAPAAGKAPVEECTQQRRMRNLC